MAGTFRGWLIAAGLAVALRAALDPAAAMQFHAVPIPDRDGVALITAIRPIIPGDLNRLVNVLGSLPPTERILAFALDSPGGDLAEAERLATLIRAAPFRVVVLGGRKCVSACFLLFAAGTTRFVEADALVGVHSASQAGHETAGSLAATAAMARDAGALGVPPAIVGKMVEATPNQMEWLTPDDLASMGVKVLPDPASPAVAETTPPDAPAQGGAVATNAAPDTPPQEPPAFQQGLADRRGWEQWFSALTGDRQSDAGFWAAHRSDPKLPSCYGTNRQNLGDWTAGCLGAEQRLAAVDARRKTEPDYRRGWNSY